MFGCPACIHVKDGNTESRTKQCMFLDYAFRVKDYRLWCSDPNVLGLLISKDVTFNESATLDYQREKAIAESDHGVGKRVGLKVDISTVQLRSSGNQVHDPENNDHAPSQQPPYSIATGREKRHIRLPRRYANLVAYALSVVEIFDLQKPSSCEKAMFGFNTDHGIGFVGKKSLRWTTSGTTANVGLKFDKIKLSDSLSKFKHCLDLVGTCVTRSGPLRAVARLSDDHCWWLGKLKLRGRIVKK